METSGAGRKGERWNNVDFCPFLTARERWAVLEKRQRVGRSLTNGRHGSSNFKNEQHVFTHAGGASYIEEKVEPHRKNSGISLALGIF